MPPSVWTSVPCDVIRNILLFTIPSAGPPASLSSLRLTCRHLNNALQQCKPDLYIRIFALQFDLDPPFRCLGYDRRILSQKVEDELRIRVTMLKDLRHDRLHGKRLDKALWTLYFMILQDQGHNLQQLRWAEAHAALRGFLRHRLYLGAEENNGWPVESAQNSLAVACLWFLSSKAILNEETKDESDLLMARLLPFVQAAFRYPCFIGSETDFEGDNPSRASEETVISAVHGVYPPVGPSTEDVPYFGDLMCECRPPPASLFAILNYFVRADLTPLEIPPHLPLNRYFLDHCNTKFPSPNTERNAGWLRPTGQPSYVLGDITGRWEGSMMVPCVDNTYKKWLSTPTIPVPFPAFGRRPLSFIFQEYYCTDESTRLPSDESTNGNKNAWLPTGCKWIEQDDGIEVFDEDGSFYSFYKPFKAGGDLADMANVIDVIVVGKPDETHKAAWGGFNCFGRIRLSDGLVALAAEALEVINPSVFRGYVTSPQNFVGRSRGQFNAGLEPANWEAAFSLSKHTV
ncbi:F-box domain-containing protein [Pleurotus pulmonarius]